jgi:hypothetical protein
MSLTPPVIDESDQLDQVQSVRPGLTGKICSKIAVNSKVRGFCQLQGSQKIV